MEEGFKMFFVYSFLGIAASILIYVLVRLFRGLKSVECQAEYLLQQAIEVIEEPTKEEKPKGFWKRLWDRVEPYDEMSPGERALRKLNKDFTFGLLPSNIFSQARWARRGRGRV